MRILYIYNEYKDRRGRYADEMRLLGHDVQTIYIRDKKIANQVTLEEITKYPIDLLFLLSPFFIAKNVVTPETIEYCKTKGIPICCYQTFNTQIPYIEQDHTWKQFDYYFTYNKGHAEYINSIGGNAFYIQMGFYPDQYFPIEMERTIDVSFMGSPQTTVPPEEDKRVIWLKGLKERGINISVWGNSFNDRGVKAKRYNSHREQNEIYNQCKVNIDLPFVNSANEFYKDKLHPKNRVYEIPGSKNFLLTIRNPDFEEMFDNTMVGYCDNNIDSMAEMIKFYLKNSQFREVMAKNAYNHAINNHTFHHRFKKIFEILEG